MKKELLLGVNIDHIATLREVRGTRYPDPIQGALEAEAAGADGITLHLREDQRHIQPRDVRVLKEVLTTRMNLELALTEKMLDFAEEIQPTFVCLVPEKREERTTEGGLDVALYFKKIQAAVARFKPLQIDVSLFIEADFKQIEAAQATGAPFIEIHTGHYAEAANLREQKEALERIQKAVTYAKSLGLTVNAGHGLHYHNVRPIAAIEDIHELNIGHAIIARALFSGLKNAIKEMRQLMREAR